MSIASAPGEIRTQGLTRRFGKTIAVRAFELNLGPGGVTGLLGPNGSGKSTFLRMLTGLVPPNAGAASVDGVALRGDGTAVRRRLAFVPGETAVYGEMRGHAHLRWLLAGRGRAALERATSVASELELPLERKVRGYSHGMKRLLLLAAALGPAVRVRILDEPTEGLDPSKRGQVLALLAREARSGVTILLSSHHLGEVERICERLLFLRRGELLDEREARDLHERARRIVRIGWKERVDPERLRNSISELGATEVRIEGRKLSLILPEGDARRALVELLEKGDFETPESLVFGELSLRELYRELYGTEGV